MKRKVRFLKKAMVFLFVATFLIFVQAPTAFSQMNFMTWQKSLPAGISAETISKAMYFLDQMSYEELTEQQIKAIEKEKEKFLRKITKIVEPKYSRYYSPEEWKEIQENQMFEGIGVEVGLAGAEERFEKIKLFIKLAMPDITDKDFQNYELFKIIAEWMSSKNEEFKGLYEKHKNLRLSNNGFLIVDVMHGEPADLAGIEKGWYIIKVDGVKLQGYSMKDAVKLIKGLKGTKVKLTLKSPDGLITDVEVVRDVISSSRVEKRMLAPGVGYIKMSDFKFIDSITKEQTIQPFIDSIEELKSTGMKKLIFDLRKNGGGYLGEADLILERLLPSGLIEFYAENRRGPDFRDVTYSSPENIVQKIFKGPIMVLVDGHSASAAELVAISLQEHKRAVIIGEKTFGKGTIQSIIEMPDKSALRFTTGHYFSPVNGICIDGRGVVPDIEVKDDPITPEDEVLQKAIEILKKK